MKTNNKLFSILGLLIFSLYSSAKVYLPQNEFQDQSAPFYTLVDIQKVYPEAATYKLTADKSILVKNKKGKTIGHLLASSDFKVEFKGFAGIVPVLIAFNDSKTITGVYLLRNDETEEFIDQVKEGKLFEKWNGKPLKAFVVTESVDAVTGAT